MMKKYPSLIYGIIFLFVFIFSQKQIQAQDFTTLEITGYNEDVIANGVGSLSTSTTNDVDGVNYCFLAEGLQLTESSTPITYGLPEDGMLESPTIDGLTYQLAPYDENNDLRIETEGVDGQETITFTEQESFEALYLMVTSGSGSCTITGTIDFDDATTQEFTAVAIPDWYNQTSLPYIVTDIGRGSRADDGLQTMTGGPRIYQLTIQILPDNQHKTITGITLQKDGNGIFNLFGASGKIAPDCIAPSNISTTAVSANTLSFSWEAATGQDTWEVALVDDGEEAPTDGTEVSETNYEFENLDANTNYDFYVRTNCGDPDGFSEWIGPFDVITACDLADGLDENFDSSSTLSQCWDTDNGAWSVNTSTSYAAHSGNNKAWISSGNGYLITAQFAIEANTNDRLEFWVKRQYAWTTPSLEVVLSTTGKEVANFTETLESQANVTNTAWEKHTIDLTDYVGETVFIAFHGSGSYMGIDDVKTIPIPLCDAPTGLKAENVAPTSATLTWDQGEASNWEIAVQPYGTGTPDSGESVDTNSYSATIDSETIYEFYVRAECTDVEGFSPWTGPYAFGNYTPIEATSGYTDDVIANGVGDPSTTTTNTIDNGNNAYFSEDYQNTGTDELLGYGLPANGDLESSTPGLHFQIAPFDTPYTGNNALRIETAGEENAGTLTFENTPNAQTVYLMLTSGGGTCSLAGTISFDDDSTMEIPETGVPDWYGGTSLPTLVSGIGRINITNGTVENPAGNPRIYELAVDLTFENQSKSISSISLYKTTGSGTLNVFGASVRFPSSCPKPTGLTAVSDMTFTAANVNWSAGNETEWEVVYGAPGFDLDSEGTSVIDDDGSAGTTIDGLEEDTNYEVYVRAVCGEDSQSEWAGPVTFYTGYCSSVPSSHDNDGITNFQIGNTDFENGSVEYTDFTDTPVELQQAVMANIQISFATGYTYGTNIWIDLNDNLIFESSELMYSGTSTDNNPTTLDASFMMPADANLGTHRMRIATADSGQSTPNPCYSGSWGVTADFIVNITPPPACLVPTGLSVSEITQTTAQVNWTAGADETEWVVAYGAPDFDPDTEGDTVTDNDGEAGITLDPLTLDTAYEVYVKAVCSETNESNWVGPVAFATLVSCPAPADLAIGDLTLTTAEVTWTAGGDETEWVVAYGALGFDPDLEGDTVTDDDGEAGTTIDGLTIDTDYDIYVKGICGEDDESEWTGPLSLYLGYCNSQPSNLDNSGITNVELGGTNFPNPIVTYASYVDTPVNLRQGANANVQITFATGFTYGTNIWIDLNDNLEFESSELLYSGESLSANPTTLDASFMMPADASIGNHRMRIATADSGQFNPNPCYGGTYGVTLDFTVTIILPTDCPDPTNLTVGGVSHNTAGLNWNTGSDETEWQVIYGAPGFDPAIEGDSVTDTDGEAGMTLENLTPETDYEVYIMAMCDDSSTSEWVGPVAFTTLQEPCFAPYGVIISNISSASAKITWTAGGSETAWQVLYGETGFDPETEGTMVVDNDGSPELVISPLLENTTYDVYVRAMCEEDNFSNWTSVMTFTTPEDICVAPSNVVISEVTDISANVAWTENDDATTWQIKYGAIGFDPDTDGTLVEDTDGTLGETIENLTAETSYEVYVRAVCDEEDYSDWSMPVNFTTTETMAVAENQFEGFTYYPNPVQDRLTLSAQSTIEQIMVYNLLGQKVIDQHPDNLTTTIELSHLQSGAYLMKVQVAGALKTVRIIKE